MLARRGLARREPARRVLSPRRGLGWKRLGLARSSSVAASEVAATGKPPLSDVARAVKHRRRSRLRPEGAVRVARGKPPVPAPPGRTPLAVRRLPARPRRRRGKGIAAACSGKAAAASASPRAKPLPSARSRRAPKPSAACVARGRSPVAAAGAGATHREAAAAVCLAAGRQVSAFAELPRGGKPPPVAPPRNGKPPLSLPPCAGKLALPPCAGRLPLSDPPGGPSAGVEGRAGHADALITERGKPGRTTRRVLAVGVLRPCGAERLLRRGGSRRDRGERAPKHRRGRATRRPEHRRGHEAPRRRRARGTATPEVPSRRTGTGGPGPDARAVPNGDWSAGAVPNGGWSGAPNGGRSAGPGMRPEACRKAVGRRWARRTVAGPPGRMRPVSFRRDRPVGRRRPERESRPGPLRRRRERPSDRTASGSPADATRQLARRAAWRAAGWA